MNFFYMVFSFLRPALGFRHAWYSLHFGMTPAPHRRPTLPPKKLGWPTLPPPSGGRHARIRAWAFDFFWRPRQCATASHGRSLLAHAPRGPQNPPPLHAPPPSQDRGCMGGPTVGVWSTHYTPTSLSLLLRLSYYSLNMVYCVGC